LADVLQLRDSFGGNVGADDDDLICADEVAKVSQAGVAPAPLLVKLNARRRVWAELFARDVAPAKAVDCNNRLVVPDLGQRRQCGGGGVVMIWLLFV
jgi:hypothetical protein